MDKAANAAVPSASPATKGDASSLALSEDVVARLASAAATLRTSPDALISRLLRCFYSSLRGLPPPVLFYIFTFLDYSTVSFMVSLTCRGWHDAVRKGEPSKFFGDLRQAHGVHVIDPVRGVFYFPRALKRVLVVPNADTGAKGKTGRTPPPPAGSATPTTTTTPPPPRRPLAVAGDMAAPASSFLTVDIRTQDTRSPPWSNVRSAVQRAIEAERVAYGEVRTPGLQRREEPALTQAAVTVLDRTIYIFGGESYEGIVLGRCYAYDPVRKRWSGLPQLREARAGACAAAFGGRIYVFGGYDLDGNVLDTYEVLDVATSRWLNPVVANGSRGFHMPQNACGLAVAAYEDVLIFAGGYRSRLAPEDTAYTYSIANSATATPMHGFPSAASMFSLVSPGAAGGGGGGGGAAGGVAHVSTPPGTPLLPSTPTPPTGRHSISRDGPHDAESWVWVFAPRTHTWCTDGPPLPSPRAFGALAVVELHPALGPCLCYFGGCTRADKPETTMLYVPLVVTAGARDESSSKTSACDTKAPEPQGAEDTAAPTSTTAAADSNAEASQCSTSSNSSSSSSFLCSADGDCVDEDDPSAPMPRAVVSRPSVERGRPAKDPHLLRCFRGDASTSRAGKAALCEWQRYARVPLGGALTSVAVIGPAESRTVILSSFYPAALIGYCKVKDLVPADVSLQLARRLAPPLPAVSEEEVVASPPPPSHSASPNSSPALGPAASSTPPPLDTSLQLEAFDTAQRQRHLEHEWSQHQRREIRHLMGAAATAASRKRPIAPQTAGEARKWSLAPMPEVQVRDDRGRPLLDRVSWKTQSLNGKFVVGIE